MANKYEAAVVLSVAQGEERIAKITDGVLRVMVIKK